MVGVAKPDAVVASALCRGLSLSRREYRLARNVRRRFYETALFVRGPPLDFHNSATPDNRTAQFDLGAKIVQTCAPTCDPGELTTAGNTDTGSNATTVPRDPNLGSSRASQFANSRSNPEAASSFPAASTAASLPAARPPGGGRDRPPLR